MALSPLRSPFARGQSQELRRLDLQHRFQLGDDLQAHDAIGFSLVVLR